MNYQSIINQLEANKHIFESLLKGLNEKEYMWQEAEGKWCLLEVLCHLYDEEREDFRIRVQTTLENPGNSPPPIDPIGWVQSRNYIGQDYSLKFEAFMDERDVSIDWLKSLTDPVWSNLYEHPSFWPFICSFVFDELVGT